MVANMSSNRRAYRYALVLVLGGLGFAILLSALSNPSGPNSGIGILEIIAAGVLVLAAFTVAFTKPSVSLGHEEQDQARTIETDRLVRSAVDPTLPPPLQAGREFMDLRLRFPTWSESGRGRQI
jgi:hypothetical protein